METATIPTPGIKASSNQIIDTVNDIARVLSQHIDEEEEQGRLSSEVVSSLKDVGFFKYFHFIAVFI